MSSSLSMPSALEKNLLANGWKPNEVAVYNALLCCGPLFLNELVRETRLQKSSVQRSLELLRAKRMVRESTVNNCPHYAAHDPKQLCSWLGDEIERLQNSKHIATVFADNYDFHPLLSVPKFRRFHGYQGVKQSYLEIIKECKEGDEIMGAFADKAGEGPELRKFFPKYVAERLKKGIRVRNLALDSPEARAYRSLDAEEMRETKLIPRDAFPALNTEINLYGDCLHCMSFDKNTAFAVIINDANLTALMRGLLHLLWESL